MAQHKNLKEPGAHFETGLDRLKQGKEGIERSVEQAKGPWQRDWFERMWREATVRNRKRAGPKITYDD